MRVTVGVSGGIAAYKAAELVRALQRRGMEVHVVMTEDAAAGRALIRNVFGAYAATLRVMPPAPGVRRRPGVRDEDQPRRRPPAPGTSRVPEP